MSALVVYFVSSSFSGNEDLSTHWEWRYASSILGVRRNYPDALKLAIETAQHQVDDLNEDYKSNGDGDLVQSYYTQTKNNIDIFWNRDDTSPRTRITIDKQDVP